MPDDITRRRLLTSGLTAGGAGVAFAALAARSAHGRDDDDDDGYDHDDDDNDRDDDDDDGDDRRVDYGPLSVKPCMNTGLPLLALPEGFEYMSYGWTGQIMSDGRPTPTDHDGMAVSARRGRYISLVRNHELSAGESNQCLVPGGMYNMNEFGGTTNILFDVVRGRFVESYTSLGGTIRNCAGGPTPWNSWISCEETFHTWNNRDDGFNHGYIFDVPGFGISDGQPIRAAGRFSHEAVAVDPRTGVVYETEDTGSSGFYKYVQPGAGTRRWRRGRRRGELLRDGGELFAMVVNDESRKDMANRGGQLKVGDYFTVTWQRVQDPEAVNGRAFDSAPDAAIFSRGEGCWEDDGLIYFVSTDGGPAELGQVWQYDPRAEVLHLLYEASDATDVDGPDNLAVSPRGGIILCEDGGSNPKRLIGLSERGETFPFCENRIVLTEADIATIDRVFPGTQANFWDNPANNGAGDYQGREWAGATFYRRWLFANVQSPGVTFAIRGPWGRGAL